MENKKNKIVGVAGQITSLLTGTSTMREYTNLAHHMRLAGSTGHESDGITCHNEAQIMAILPDGTRAYLGTAQVFEVDMERHRLLPSEEWASNSPGLRFKKGWQKDFLAQQGPCK